MNNYNITNGDYARFAITAQEPVVKKIYDKKPNNGVKRLCIKIFGTALLKEKERSS